MEEKSVLFVASVFIFGGVLAQMFSSSSSIPLLTGREHLIYCTFGDIRNLAIVVCVEQKNAHCTIFSQGAVFL